ncbi:hypothetical protein FRUB_09652 [Fimbriiglobus ruber]|uniref:Uncharacterized protein n=1 Tax=Fimbriiglobus ruber TaxID=1908690 RepID=A0A225CZM0_9BACT|nr:hypothetical protein FRUB_09652 [Fimbriiglobus ruber]
MGEATSNLHGVTAGYQDVYYSADHPTRAGRRSESNSAPRAVQVTLNLVHWY